MTIYYLLLFWVCCVLTIWRDEVYQKNGGIHTKIVYRISIKHWSGRQGDICYWLALKGAVIIHGLPSVVFCLSEMFLTSLCFYPYVFISSSHCAKHCHSVSFSSSSVLASHYSAYKISLKTGFLTPYTHINKFCFVYFYLFTSNSALFCLKMIHYTDYHEFFQLISPLMYLNFAK